MILSKAANQYKKDMAQLFSGVTPFPLGARLRVDALFHHKKYHNRELKETVLPDVDNFGKGLLDALAFTRVIENDERVDVLLQDKRGDRADNTVDITITILTGE